MLESSAMVPVLDQVNQLAAELVSITNCGDRCGGGRRLSFLQWRLLAVLGNETERSGCTRSWGGSAPRCPRRVDFVARMERRGLVSRSRDPIDGRGRLIALTGQGSCGPDRVVGWRRAILAERLAPVPNAPGSV